MPQMPHRIQLHHSPARVGRLYTNPHQIPLPHALARVRQLCTNAPSNSTPSFPGKSQAGSALFTFCDDVHRITTPQPPLGYSEAQVFQLSLKAIHYVNGDDGYLLADAVSGAVGVYLGYCTLLKVLPVDQDDLGWLL